MADIKSYIDKQRTAAAFLAVLGIIVSRIFVPSPFLEFGVVVFFADAIPGVPFHSLIQGVKSRFTTLCQESME